ncbi:MAG: PAS domain-containing protein [Planctomycetota bacterium]|jgi:PAS domain S-box-containing protein
MFRRSGKWNSIVNEQKQVRQILRHLGTVMGQLDEGVIVVDLKGTLHFANAAWAKMHGRKTSTGLLGKQISEFYTKEHMKKDVIRLAEEAKRRGRFKGTLEHVGKDGKTFVTQTKMAALKDDEGRVCGLVVIAKDATKHEQLEQGVKKTAAKGKSRGEQTQQTRQKETEHKQSEESANKTAAKGKSRGEQTQQTRQKETERRHVKEGPNQDRSELQQRIDELSTQLTAVNEKLQQEAAERKQTEKELKQNRDQLQEHVEQRTAELKGASDQLHQQITKLKVLQEASEEDDTEGGFLKEDAELLDPDKLKALSEMAKRLT